MRYPAATLFFFLVSCTPAPVPYLTPLEKDTIRQSIQRDIDAGIEATRNKNIDEYMARIPDDLLIHDESGELITRDQQRANVLRDWSIIDTTLNLWMKIDSLQFLTSEKLLVYTDQYWQRMMFQRDGITLDTVVTTQRHRETWRKTEQGWFGFDIVEFGGEIYINGERYNPD